MIKRSLLGLASTLLLQLALTGFAADAQVTDSDQEPPKTSSINVDSAVKSATVSSKGSDSAAIQPAAILPVPSLANPVSNVLTLVETRDPSAPLVLLSPETPLNALYMMPISGSVQMLQGQAQVSTIPSPSSAAPTTTIPPKASDTPIGLVTDGPIIIDNDLEKEMAVTEFIWKEIPDSEGKMHIDAGGRFPVIVITSHTSKTANVGDPVEARLKVDIKIGGRLIAPKGATVIGHIASCERARKMLQAEFSMKRWMRPSGALGVQFDEILTSKGEHIPLVAMPAQQPRIVKNKAEGRVLGVNHKGEIVSPLSGQIKSQAVHLGVRAAASAAGPFSFGIVPVVYGVAGAISPSFAFMHPVGQNMRYRRLKGFGLGVMSGLPGGFLVSDYLVRGEESVIKPGDEFLAEFKQKFTGEVATDAQLAPNARVKVHGQVLPKPKKRQR
jgi:hypothetical protein